MPRDSGGTYTLPAGNPVVSGTVIASSWANTTMDDVAIEMTDSLSRTGNGAMQAALKHIDGAETSPSQTFNNDPLTGRYLAAVSDMRDTVAGVDKMRLTAAGLEVWIDPDWVPVIYGTGGYKPYKKNFLINGDMSVFQRGAIVSPTNGDYTLDRWFVSNQVGTFDISRTTFNGTDSRGNTYSGAYGMKVTSTSGSAFSIAQRVEDLSGLFGQTVTVSLAVRLTVGTVIAQELTQISLVQREGSTNQGSINILAAPVAITSDMVWIEATGILPLYTGTNNTYTSTEVILNFGGINNGDRVDILAVQLESGSVATPFEYVSAGDNLAACERYYQKSYPIGVPAGSNTGLAQGIFDTSIGVSGAVIGYVQYRTPLRVAPLPVIYDAIGNINTITTEGANNGQPATPDNASEKAFKVFKSPVSRISFHWSADAEL